MVAPLLKSKFLVTRVSALRGLTTDEVELQQLRNWWIATFLLSEHHRHRWQLRL